MVRQGVTGGLDIDETIAFFNDLMTSLVSFNSNSNESKILVTFSHLQDIKAMFPSLLADILALAGENKID